MDGGGIRGIISGQILCYVENKLKELTHDPSATISSYFDLIAGTSTGGILTCAYLCPGENSKPKFSAVDAVDIYLKSGPKIFHNSIWNEISSFHGIRGPKFSDYGLETNLLKYFGNIKLSDLLKPCLITSYDTRRRYVHLFTSHDAKQKSGYDFYIKDVARATSAAPSYFRTAGIRSISGVNYSLIDGGIFANNPALCGFAEASKLYSNPEKPLSVAEVMILSIGTGSVKKEYPYHKAKRWGSIQWIRPLIEMMMSGVSDTVDYQLQCLFAAAGKSDYYLRINPSLEDANSDIDDVSETNLQALKEAGIYAAEKTCEKIDAFLKNMLIDESNHKIKDVNKTLL